ncbi:MAG: Uma2 family endonuclease [Cyanobacteria bacterium P01_D01_bin.123]
MVNSQYSSAIAPEPTWQFSLEQYHAMVRSGILTDDDPVEFLEGWLVLKMPKRPPDRVAMRLLRSTLERIIPTGWYVDSQEPITTADSEPEPDVVIVRGRTQDYLDRHPAATDLALVVEISDTTLQRDRELKKRTYSRANVDIYWIVNLPERQVEVYSFPLANTDSPDYARCQIFRAGDRLPVQIDNVVVATILVDEVLPPSG